MSGGVTDSHGGVHLKKWRLITTDNHTARIFNALKCSQPRDFKHVPIEGSRTRRTGFYLRLMCEFVMHVLYPDIIAHHAPAMPVSPISDEPQVHREHEPKEKPENDSFIFDSVDPLASAARLGSDEEPTSDEAEDHETRDDRLRREATSLEFCQGGKMLKRYCKRARQIDDEDDDRLIHRATILGDIIEADHMFPSQEAKGLSDEQSALVVRDRFSGAVLVYTQSERNEQAIMNRHFAGKYLSGKKGVLFVSDNAKELTGAASRLGWIPDPSVPGFGPTMQTVRVRSELSRKSLGQHM